MHRIEHGLAQLGAGRNQALDVFQQPRNTVIDGEVAEAANVDEGVLQSRIFRGGEQYLPNLRMVYVVP